MGKANNKRDIYYRKAKEEGWRARSAFKLLQVDEQFDIFSQVHRAVDLCAAPGSWSQVLQRKLLKHRKEAAQSQVILVAVDLQEMAPLEGVITMQGDITNETTAQQIIAHFGGQRAQLVVCDGAPDVTGMHDIDEYLQSQLILAALNITTHLLDENGTFVAKVFKSKDIHLLTSQLNIFFKQVYVTKPKSSRLSSIESFVVCKDFCMPQEYVPQMINPLDAKLYAQQLELNKKTEQVQHIVPYLACGDLSSFDST